MAEFKLSVQEKIYKIFRFFKTIFKISYQSETSKYRHDLLHFCNGNGLDIGFGGDPIRPSAITIDSSKGTMAYCGDHPLNLDGDARHLYWFANDVFDYVYSSHCLEDMEDTEAVLIEWLRVLKPGGKLVLLLPDQKRYERYCRATGLKPNANHKIKNFSLIYLKNIFTNLDNAKIIFEKDMLNDYNFELVIEKTGDKLGHQNLNI